jgi:serine/threonine protein kinase
LYFAGNSDIEQLAKIFNVLGTPKLPEWSGVELLPNYVEFESRDPMELVHLFGRQSGSIERPADLELLLKMLALNPSKRITAKNVSLGVVAGGFFVICFIGFESRLL